MVKSPIQVALLIALLASNFQSFATVILQTPGCYTLRGIVEKISSDEVAVKTFPETRSEEIISVKIISESPELEKKLVGVFTPKTPLELEVYAPENGKPSKQKLTTKARTFKMPISAENLLTNVWRPCP